MENEKKTNNIPRAPRPSPSLKGAYARELPSTKKIGVNDNEESVPLKMGVKKPQSKAEGALNAQKPKAVATGRSVSRANQVNQVNKTAQGGASSALRQTPAVKPTAPKKTVGADGTAVGTAEVKKAPQPMQRAQTAVNSQLKPKVQTANSQNASRPPMKSKGDAPVNTNQNQIRRNTNRIEPERIISPEKQRRRETVSAYRYESPKRTKKTGFFRVLGQAFAFLLTFVLILAITVFVSLKMMCGDTSPAAKELLVTTLLETGQMKGVASIFLSEEEIQAIVDGNAMSTFDEEIDSTLISIDKNNAGSDEGERQDIEIKEIAGRNFFGTLMIVRDPSRVSLASTYPFTKEGVTLDQLVKDAGAIGGINGGLYNSANNSGGRPYGVLVCNGQIQQNSPGEWPGLVLIGFTEDNILEIIPIDGYSKKDIENLVAERRIRDAVCFQEEASDKNNHFVQLVINGEARDMNGMGSGLNPRTAIGQCADGSVLLLVTDGRGKSGHLGASASDLIEVMLEYGAINAANLDGGSSSCMYYNDEYLMTSVTFYYTNASWKLPAGFVVK